MKKEQFLRTLEISTVAVLMSVITGMTAYAVDEPPSVSSPFGDSGTTTPPPSSDTPPSLNGTQNNTPAPAPAPAPTPTPNKGNTKETLPTPPPANNNTNTPAPKTNPTSAPAPKKLAKTGPELAILVLPSLLAGYFVGKGRKK